MIFLFIATLLLYRGAQVELGHFPYSDWAFASHAVGNIFSGLSHGVVQALETTFVLAQIGAVASFLVVVVYSKHFHIFVSEPNVLFSRRPIALGALATTPNMNPEELSEDDVFGAGEITHFSWKQLLDLLSCTECGRCQDQCPAWNTGKPLSPKLVIMDLRDHWMAKAPYILGEKTAEPLEGLDLETTKEEGHHVPESGFGRVPEHGPEQAARPLVGTAEQRGAIDPHVLWSFVACGACVEQCPVGIEHVDHIVAMRRYQVMMESEFPSELSVLFKNLE